MEIFKSKQNASLADLKANNEALQSTIADLSAKVEEAKTQSQDFLAKFDAIKAEHKAAVDALAVQVTELSAKVTELTKEKTALVETHKEEIKAVAEIKEVEVQRMAAIQMAQVGVREDERPPKVETAVAPESDQERILNEWKNASIQDKPKIFNKHKAAILKARGISEETWDLAFGKSN